MQALFLLFLKKIFTLFFDNFFDEKIY